MLPAKPGLVNPAGPCGFFTPQSMDFTENQRNAPIGAAKEKDPILVEYSLHLYAAIGRLGILDQFFVEPPGGVRGGVRCTLGCSCATRRQPSPLFNDPPIWQARNFFCSAPPRTWKSRISTIEPRASCIGCVGLVFDHKPCLPKYSAFD